MTTDQDPTHMWRVVSATFSADPVTEYVCDLCHEHLFVRAGETHPLEC